MVKSGLTIQSDHILQFPVWRQRVRMNELRVPKCRGLGGKARAQYRLADSMTRDATNAYDFFPLSRWFYFPR